MAYLISGSLQRSNPAGRWQDRVLRLHTKLYPWPLAPIIMLLSLTGARLRGRWE